MLHFLKIFRTTNGQQLIVDSRKVDTETFRECNKVFILDKGEIIFVGYGVHWSGVEQLDRRDTPVTLYFDDEGKHIYGFQTAANFDGTYAFLA